MHALTHLLTRSVALQSLVYAGISVILNLMHAASRCLQVFAYKKFIDSLLQQEYFPWSEN